jgi:hypothetical protein
MRPEPRSGKISRALAYLAAWAIILAEGEKTSIAEDLLSKTRHGSPS